MPHRVVVVVNENVLLLGDASLEHVVEVVLQQQLCVLVDCISQPYEAISRLGCSCIRYSEHLSLSTVTFTVSRIYLRGFAAT